MEAYEERRGRGSLGVVALSEPSRRSNRLTDSREASPARKEGGYP